MKFSLSAILILVFIVAAQYAVYGQKRPEGLRMPKDIFKNFAGYKDDDGKYYFEGEGYNIIITTYAKPPTQANFKKVADQIEGRKKVIVKALNNDPLQNYVLDMSSNKSDPPVIVRNFLIAGRNNDILEVGIARYNSLDPRLTNEIVSSIFYDSIYAPILVDTKNGVIDFIGRRIKFDDDCFWLKPHVIKCTNTGEITWYQFNSLAEAEGYRQTELAIARKAIKKRMAEADTVRVIFEGKETLSDRLLFDSDAIGLIFNSNRLVNAYYIAAEIRGRFVYCRLVFSDIAMKSNDPESGLPRLIARFMRFK